MPKWCIEYGAYLNQKGMLFRHWIACRMPKAFPRGKRMSPAHYGLLYYTKGEPTVFNKVYTPIQVCRHCGGEIRDYGGHRKKLNPQGINLMDIWDMPEDVWEDTSGYSTEETFWTELEEIWSDIPPVRHRQYKTRGANELAPPHARTYHCYGIKPRTNSYRSLWRFWDYILCSREVASILARYRNW
ncbi:hypothetical protein [Scytonema sp. NUACC26]|uniref:hypothetical protein n=1 Tax=Scytonema sp. NUACC26 TaxID=3140176 RepID=UPI0038B2D1D7